MRVIDVDDGVGGKMCLWVELTDRDTSSRGDQPAFQLRADNGRG